MLINLFIQARMSSSRFPGKVLSPVRGEPLIMRLINSMSGLKNISNLCVLTSSQSSDRPLTAFLEKEGIPYYCGSLDNVYDRFKKALEVFPCHYFVRLCADSPFIPCKLVQQIIDNVCEDYDLVTNVYPRTFPKGHSVEVVKVKTYKNIDETLMTESEKEHITKFYYTNPDCYKIKSIRNTIDESHINFSIDTIEDLKRLEN